MNSIRFVDFELRQNFQPMTNASVSARTPAHDKVVVLEAGRVDALYWSALWRARELMYVLAKRDIMVRYRQTVIGLLWSLVRPALNVFVFTLVFGVVARLPSQDGVPYPVLVLSGLMPWALFSTLLTDMSNSLLINAATVSKSYFPRLLVPLSTIPVNLFDFVISFVLMAMLMLYYGFVPSWRIVFIPALAVLTILAASGLGLMLAALNVRYRDVRYIVPFLISIGLLLSPVGYTPEAVPENLRFLFSLNPMVSVIEGFRWAILGQAFVPGVTALAASALFCGAFLIAGIAVFRKSEREFADVI